MWRSLAETDRPARPVSGPLPGWAGSSSRPHLVMVMTVAGLSPLDYSVTLGAHCHHSPPLAVGSMGLFSGPKLVPKLPACVWGNVHVYKAAVAAGIFLAKILHKNWLCVDWRKTLGSTKSTWPCFPPLLELIFCIYCRLNLRTKRSHPYTERHAIAMELDSRIWLIHNEDMGN